MSVGHRVVILDQYGNPLRYQKAGDNPIVANYLIDEDGEAFGVERIQNRQRVSSLPYYYEIADGYVSGHSRFTFEGLNSDVPATFENIGDLSIVYTYMTTPAVLYASSSNVGDDQEYELVGLDENYEFQTIRWTCNGQNKVKIGIGQKFLRTHKATNKGTTNNAGDIYVYEDDTVVAGVPQTASKMKEKIVAGYNTSFGGHFTVPADKIAFLVDGYVSTSSVKEITTFFRYRSPGGVFIYSRPVVLNSSALQFNSALPAKVPEKTDMDFIGKALLGSGNVQMGVIGWLEDM